MKPKRLAGAVSKKNAARVALSVFLVYHLFCVVVAPNSGSYFGRRFAKIVAPYVSFFELGSQWGFFAPDPGPPPVFIEYDVIGSGGDRLGSGTWPEKESPFFLRERQNRRIGVARFVITDNNRIERTLGPYFCRINPGAKTIRLWKVIQGMPNLYDVANGRRRIDDGIGTERKYVSGYVCPGSV